MYTTISAFASNCKGLRATGGRKNGCQSFSLQRELLNHFGVVLSKLLGESARLCESCNYRTPSDSAKRNPPNPTPPCPTLLNPTGAQTTKIGEAKHGQPRPPKIVSVDRFGAEPDIRGHFPTVIVLGRRYALWGASPVFRYFGLWGILGLYVGYDGLQLRSGPTCRRLSFELGMLLTYCRSYSTVS